MGGATVLGHRTLTLHSSGRERNAHELGGSGFVRGPVSKSASSWPPEQSSVGLVVARARRRVPGTVNLDWRGIRPLDGRRDKVFEELCAQLARSEVADEAEFIRKGDPDAGVECFAVYGDGSAWAWQAEVLLNAWKLAVVPDRRVSTDGA